MSEGVLNITDYYEACCRKLQPFINFSNGSDPLVILNETQWGDDCGDNSHYTKWVITDASGNEVWRQEDFVNMSGGVPIGIGSTGTSLILPNGIEDLLSFLTSQSICFCKGDKFSIWIVAKNCLNVKGTSNILEFTACRSSESLMMGNIPLMLNGTPLIFSPTPPTKIVDCQYTDPTGKTHIIKGLESYDSKSEKATIILSDGTNPIVHYSDFENQFVDFQNFVNHLNECSCGCISEEVQTRNSNTAGLEEYFEIIEIGDAEKEIIPTINYDGIKISNRSDLPIICTIFHNGNQSRIRVAENNSRTIDWESPIINKLRFGEIDQNNMVGPVSSMGTQEAYHRHEIEVTFFNSK